MKVSEITDDVIQEYLRIDEPDESEKVLLEGIKQAAIQYTLGYTGMEQEELDDHEDITLAVLALISDMYDNRAIQAKETGTNRIVESILGLYSKNLL
ncbi:MAG: head-tail connector protein [Acetivibrio ethanolgignens]